MAEKDSRTVNTLNEYLEWAAQFNDGQYLFRGVKNKCYELQASACRRLPPECSGNPSRLLRINKRLIEEARRRGHDQKMVEHYWIWNSLLNFSTSAQPPA